MNKSTGIVWLVGGVATAAWLAFAVVSPILAIAFAFGAVVASIVASAREVTR